jgi:hypothetical protein
MSLLQSEAVAGASGRAGLDFTPAGKPVAEHRARLTTSGIYCTAPKSRSKATIRVIFHDRAGFVCRLSPSPRKRSGGLRAQVSRRRGFPRSPRLALFGDLRGLPPLLIQVGTDERLLGRQAICRSRDASRSFGRARDLRKDASRLPARRRTPRKQPGRARPRNPILSQRLRRPVTHSSRGRAGGLAFTCP